MNVKILQFFPDFLKIYLKFFANYTYTAEIFPHQPNWAKLQKKKIGNRSRT